MSSVDVEQHSGDVHNVDEHEPQNNEGVDELVEDTMNERVLDNLSDHHHDDDELSINADISRPTSRDEKIRFLVPLIGAIANLMYSLVYLILCIVEIKVTVEFVHWYEDNESKNSMDDDQVEMLSYLSLFSLVLSALVSLIGSISGIVACIMIWKKEYFFNLTNTHKSYVLWSLIVSGVWLAATILSFLPLGLIYLLFDCVVQLAVHKTVNAVSVIGILLGAVFIAFSVLLFRRVWVFKNKFGY